MHPAIRQPQPPALRPLGLSYDAQEREVVARIPVERVGQVLLVGFLGFLTYKGLERLFKAA